MPRPPRDALRTEILAVSLRLFSSIGFRASSLQMIAAGAGCSKAALLYHFSSKSAILQALSTDLVEDIEQMRSVLAEVPAPQRQTRTLELAVAIVVRHRQAIAMLRGIGDVEELRPLAERGAQWAEEMRTGLIGPLPHQRDRVAAMTFEHGLVGACLTLHDLTDEELADELLALGGRIFGLDVPISIPS
ncbi:TetR/AcrR family transcriptional regulator [Nocardioides mangrovicus]|uniref:TetR/AcrR family transcriptional regulator n=1 Tax=Nocardioides mangrovicus TaxID=2478913 RepID=A0A3L8NX35_9ACTN|nr:TetR/AcrR family transcriptional regulator [Nocardioides mangrovicus]RLV47735.1 TetR/AcrR family transcriptional regulator [Nocardioides mangrovicus]